MGDRMTRQNNHLERNEQKWDRRSVDFDKGRHDYFRLMQWMTIRRIPLHAGINFLDIGCGTGWAVRHVARLMQNKGNYYGIDISQNMIDDALENSNGLENIHFLKANAEQLPFEKDYFDYIICTNSFHHYQHPLKALGEIRRVLRPKGSIYILDLTSDNLLLKYIDRRTRAKEAEHVKFYSTREYRSMFEQAQLQYLRSMIILYPLKLHLARK
jgi:ubiquinone/menaquinone biosynthesis C-methylase UbiE